MTTISVVILILVVNSWLLCIISGISSDSVIPE